MQEDIEHEILTVIRNSLSRRLVSPGLPWDMARDVVKALRDSGFDIYSKNER